MTSETAALAPLQVRNVLVPLDGSEFPLRAMPTARVLAHRFDAALHTVSVVNDVERADHLRTVAAGALDVDLNDEHVVVLDSVDPAEAIAGRARELAPAIVCLTTHGRGRLRGAFIGSVARTLVHASSEPIVALGPMADNPGWSPRPTRWPEPLAEPRLVACVDGSSTSEQVLPLAAAWARALEMSLTILTVTDDSRPISTTPQESRYGSHGNAETYVNDLAEQWRTQVPVVDGEVLRDPIGPASAIRQHLDERPAGLLALTTSARSGLERLRFGAAAASIVHASIAPCLVAPVRPS